MSAFPLDHKTGRDEPLQQTVGPRDVGPGFAVDGPYYSLSLSQARLSRIVYVFQLPAPKGRTQRGLSTVGSIAE